MSGESSSPAIRSALETVVNFGTDMFSRGVVAIINNFKGSVVDGVMEGS